MARSRRCLRSTAYPLSVRCGSVQTVLCKYEASHTIASHGFPTLPCALLKIYYDDHEEIVRDFARYQPERVL